MYVFVALLESWLVVLLTFTCQGPKIVLDTEHRLHKYIRMDSTDEHKESQGGHSTYSTL